MKIMNIFCNNQIFCEYFWNMEESDGEYFLQESDFEKLIAGIRC